MLLFLLEIKFLDSVSFYRPLTGTELLCWQNSFGNAMMYYGITFALGTAAVFLTLQYAHNGHQMHRKSMK